LIFTTERLDETRRESNRQRRLDSFGVTPEKVSVVMPWGGAEQFMLPSFLVCPTHTKRHIEYFRDCPTDFDLCRSLITDAQLAPSRSKRLTDSPLIRTTQIPT
jgi:hypothetical protein